jgi:hypothetical protein
VDPDKLSTPERALWQAFPRGEQVDLTRARGARARTIRAGVIAALLLGVVPPEPGRIAAIRLVGARITGTLGLGHATVATPVRMQACEFDAAIDLSGAKARDVDLEGCALAGLIAPLAEIDGNLGLASCACAGQIVLTGAHITGALQLSDARVDNHGAVALLANRLVIDDDLLARRATVQGEWRLAAAQVGGIIDLTGATIRNEGGRALDASNIFVGARFLARDGFSAQGEARFARARVGGDLSLRGSQLSNPGGDALLAYGVEVGGDMALSGVRADGAIRLSRATIGAAILLDGAQLVNPAGDALRCRNTQARTLTLGPGLEADGIVDVRQSHFAEIRDDPGCWPPRLRLSWLSYEALEPPLSAAERVQWLRRDVDGYLPQNYLTLATMYRSLGDDAAARVVLLARERRRREQLPWYGQFWSLTQEATVGYGYRPLRAATWLVAFLAIGTLVFGLHHPPPLPGTAHPSFNPLIYTVDLLVPLVDLGMRNVYDPQGPQRWLAYFLMAVGWIFVTTIAAAIIRVLQRQ